MQKLTQPFILPVSYEEGGILPPKEEAVRAGH